MGTYRIAEDNLKNDIFKAYSGFYDEPDRRQKHFERFLDKTLRWFTDYLFNEEELASDKLWKALERVLKKERKEERNFFPYLRTTLNNVRNAYLRDEGWIPRDKKQELNDLRKFLDRLERESEKELSNLEKVRKISLYRGISEDEAWKLVDEMEMGKIVSLDIEKNDDTGNMYDLIKSETFNPLDELSRQNYCDAVKLIIESNKGKKRRCLKALFTLHCYEKNILFEEMDLVLDDKILELCKEAHPKKVTDKEVYMIYNPIKSAGESASRLKKQNPELFL